MRVHGFCLLLVPVRFSDYVVHTQRSAFEHLSLVIPPCCGFDLAAVNVPLLLYDHQQVRPKPSHVTSQLLLLQPT
jgi:hypothetical protein